MNREDEQQIAAAEREDEMARLFAIGDQAPKPEDRVMRRTLIVSAVMLSLLTMLAPPASASDTVGCQKQTSHRAVCWNYKRYAVFFKAELRFRDGTWRTYWFKLNSNDRWGKHTALAIKSVSWDSWRL